MHQALTYCGLLDDFAAKHTDRAITTVQELNRHLIDAVLFGDPLLVNDGHVLLNEAIRHAVTHPKTSPTRTLVEAGYLKILTRTNGELGKVASEMVNRGISTAKAFVETPEYATYQLKLDEWDSTLNSGACRDSFLRWPPNRNTSKVFNSLARKALAHSIETETSLAKEFRLFRHELEKVSNRTIWEDAANRLREHWLSDAAYRSLMRTANEAYQYHWGCVLYHEDNPVRVQTQLPRYLSTLDRSLEETVATREKPPIKFFVPNLDFARKAVGDRWELLAEVSRSGAPTNKAKQAFMDALLLYYTSDDVTHDEMQAEAKKYGRCLAKHFGHPERAAAGVDAVFLAPAVVGAIVGGPPGAGAGLAIGIAGFIANRLHVDRLLLKIVPRRSKAWIKELEQPPPDAVTCFELDPAQAMLYQSKAGRWQGGI